MKTHITVFEKTSSLKKDIYQGENINIDIDILKNPYTKGKPISICVRMKNSKIKVFVNTKKVFEL